MPEQEEYRKALTELIQKHMVILGPNIAVDRARKVPGIKVSDEGEVLAMGGDSVMVFKGVMNEFRALSEYVFGITMAALVKKYPQLKFD